MTFWHSLFTIWWKQTSFKVYIQPIQAVAAKQTGAVMQGPWKWPASWSLYQQDVFENDNFFPSQDDPKLGCVVLGANKSWHTDTPPTALILTSWTPLGLSMFRNTAWRIQAESSQIKLSGLFWNIFLIMYHDPYPQLKTMNGYKVASCLFHFLICFTVEPLWKADLWEA